MSDETTLLPCPFCGSEARMLGTKERWFNPACSNSECGCEWTDSYVTEAEAIAAWNTRADYHGYEQAAIEAWKSIKTWNTRATHGTLTAEQVREAAKSNSRQYESPVDDGVWIREYDWQAIADELNARAERTCECVAEYAKSPIDGKTIVLHRCSACNELMRPHMNYCPNCGRKCI